VTARSNSFSNGRFRISLHEFDGTIIVIRCQETLSRLFEHPLAEIDADHSAAAEGTEDADMAPVPRRKSSEDFGGPRTLAMPSKFRPAAKGVKSNLEPADRSFAEWRVPGGRVPRRLVLEDGTCLENQSKHEIRMKTGENILPRLTRVRWWQVAVRTGLAGVRAGTRCRPLCRQRALMDAEASRSNANPPAVNRREPSRRTAAHARADQFQGSRGRNPPAGPGCGGAGASRNSGKGRPPGDAPSRLGEVAVGKLSLDVVRCRRSNMITRAGVVAARSGTSPGRWQAGG
jgi:hypothetical protein